MSNHASFHENLKQTSELKALKSAQTATNTALAQQLPAYLSAGGFLQVSLAEGTLSSEGASTEILQGAGLPDTKSAMGNLKVSVEEGGFTSAGLASDTLQGAGLPVTKSAMGNLKVSIEEGGFTSAGLASDTLQGAGLPTVLSMMGNLKVAVAESSYEQVDVAVPGSQMLTMAGGIYSFPQVSQGVTKLKIHLQSDMSVNALYIQQSVDGIDWLTLSGVGMVETSYAMNASSTFLFGNVTVENPMPFVRLYNDDSMNPVTLTKVFYQEIRD